MLISKSIIEEFEYNIICDSTLFYFSTIYFTNYSLHAKRLLYTFLDSIFAVSYVAPSPVKILTGLCFVGTPLLYSNIGAGIIFSIKTPSQGNILEKTTIPWACCVSTQLEVSQYASWIYLQSAL